MSNISDERLAELVQVYVEETERAIPWVGDHPLEMDVHAALRELQRLRAAQEPACQHEHTRPSQTVDGASICQQCGQTVYPVVRGMHIPRYR